MEFAEREARGVSSTYERLSLAVARGDEVLALLGTLPAAKRQPNLLFGVVRLLGGPVGDPAAFREYTVANWPALLRLQLWRTGQLLPMRWTTRPSAPPPSTRRSCGLSADFHAANWTPGSGVFVAESASAQPGDGDVGEVGLAEDG